jgi:hypothetical protein
MSTRINLTDLSRKLGLSLTNTRIHMLQKQGAPERDAAKTWDEAEAIAWVRKQQLNDNRVKSAANGPSPRHVRDMFKAKEAEIDYKERIGALIPRADMEREQAEMVLLVRYAFQSLKHKLPPLLIGKDLPSMSKIIAEHVNECFVELSTQSDEQDALIIEKIEAAYQAQLRQQAQPKKKKKKNRG